MSTFRIGFIALAASAVLSVFQQPAQADVRTLRPTQTLPRPANSSYESFGFEVAIDGPHIIVLALDEGPVPTYAALLYRRNNSDGRWVYMRTLVTATGAFWRVGVAMKNRIAAVTMGGHVSLFEYTGGDYVPAVSAAPIIHPGGVAISGDSLLIGGNNCDYDAVVYQKGADGHWGISGRLDDNAGACEDWGMEAELNYGYALLRPHYGGVATAWRRNGTALDWVPAGVLTPPPGTTESSSPYALQGATAVATNGLVFRRSGSSSWTLQGKVTSVDHDDTFGLTHAAVYRDGVLATTESGSFGWTLPRIYLETSPGRFEHVATLKSSFAGYGADISGRTVVAPNTDALGHQDVEIFTLPLELRAPAPIANDFEDHDTSDLEALSGQFQLATRGSNDVLAQSNPNGLAIAVAADSDWTDYQRVEANFVQTSGDGDSWVGLVARYVDANNYYFAVIRTNQTYAVYKRVHGVDTLLQEGTYYPPISQRVVLVVDGDQISLKFGSQPFLIGTDRSLPHGRAGLATWRARADFDDVYVAGTSEYGLQNRAWGWAGHNVDVDLTTAGGNWQVPWHEQEDPEDTTYPLELRQLDMSGDARAYTGTPVGNMDINTRVRLDAFGASPQSAWFGVMARYVDPANFYYVTARNTGQIQIRKVVDGVITVLASASFTPVAGQYYDLRFLVINDQLQVFVDRTFMASAHDDAIARGQYGLATYRTAATWESLSAVQP
jgi:hypothetical protein